ncbi:MAG: hypothetical protein ACE5FD_01900 [Anaerolineae bacterium]
MSELETFVLGYLKQLDSIVEPPVFGIHEVLLPDEAAERWRTAVYQRLTFNDTEDDSATRLGYNHPWVERMVAEAREQTASTQTYINGLRLNKKDLDKMAMKEWAVINGRVSQQRRATQSRVRSTYVCFNFKADVISDEKQEQLVSIIMDAHTGYPAAEAALIEAQAAAAEPDGVLDSLSDAPVRWRSDDNRPLKAPLD